ncbi:MAG: AmmeMemoRadiSam system radical SAM enzyme [Thermoplasmatota archaeon]
MKEAMFWVREKNEAVRCNLCPHHCTIAEGNRGICNVRENRDGTLYSIIYGKSASLAVDPIEKKPLYHFHPGTSVLSFGTMGCNFNCNYCQNASLSCGDPDSSFMREYTVDEMVFRSLDYNGIAWTYNEPSINYEFTYDVSKSLKEKGEGYVVYVTNGFMEIAPLKRISPYLDAMNIDIKAFHKDFYKKIVGGKLKPVLETTKKAVELGIHVELTYLVVPGYNDDAEELRGFCEWIKNDLGEDTVTHFSRFHPDHNMRDVHATPSKKMKEARKIAKKVGLNFVYLGNLPAENDTICPNCGKKIVTRSYFSSGRVHLDDGRCPRCGREIPIIT